MAAMHAPPPKQCLRDVCIDTNTAAILAPPRDYLWVGRARLGAPREVLLTYTYERGLAYCTQPRKVLLTLHIALTDGHEGIAPGCEGLAPGGAGGCDGVAPGRSEGVAALVLRRFVPSGGEGSLRGRARMLRG